MHPYVYGPKFMWNLDCSVGKGGANSMIGDVSFIQWYYTLAADFHMTNPENKSIYRKVRVTGACNGSDNDPLVAAIFAQQKALNHSSIDGRVSVVKGSGMLGAKAFMLMRLEARFAIMYPRVWPRLDLIPGCPISVMQVSQYAIPNISEI